MTIHLYIDTNVYLTFYSFTKDDLQELGKLVTLVNTENVKLYLPEQTKNEFYRNRETKIAESLDKLRTSKLENQFPRLCHSYEDFKTMVKALKQFESHKSKLLEQLQHDAENGSLKADDVIEQLFSKAVHIETSPEILSKAMTRYDIGNPPGKDKSYGDAINWETLLEAVPSKKKMYFISDDKDFYSKLNSDLFNTFLLKEWSDKKESDLIHYRRLSDFFKAKFPDIEISVETEKDIVIKNLYDAESYYDAKNSVRKLQEYEGFSIKQLNEIATAFFSNSQIHWIKDDYVIRKASQELIQPNFIKLDKSVLKRYKRVFEID